MVKSRRTREATHVARTLEVGNTHEIVLGKRNGRPGHIWKEIKNVNEIESMVCMSFSWLKAGSSVGCCKHDKKPAGSVRSEEVLDQLKH